MVIIRVKSVRVRVRVRPLVEVWVCHECDHVSTELFEGEKFR